LKGLNLYGAASLRVPVKCSKEQVQVLRLTTPNLHPSDEDLSLGTPELHPSDEDLSLGTPGTEMRLGPLSLRMTVSVFLIRFGDWT